LVCMESSECKRIRLTTIVRRAALFKKKNTDCSGIATCPTGDARCAMTNEPVDVVLVGYIHEWEAVEYVQDMISTGQKKGMILLGESRSAQAG
jgi:hypothetical protein